MVRRTVVEVQNAPAPAISECHTAALISAGWIARPPSAADSVNGQPTSTKVQIGFRRPFLASRARIRST